MTKGPKRKRNHWVPRPYLRAFAADDAREKIWTLSKGHGEPRRRPIRNVAVKHYLYAPNGPEGRDYAFEERLSDLEQFFGSQCWKALTTDFVDLTDRTIRKMVSLLTAVMYLRNPARLDDMQSMHSALVDLYSCFPQLPDSVEIGGSEYGIDKSSWPAFRDASDDDVRRMWIDQVGDGASLAKILAEMRWAIVVSDQPAFITTDNPVVLLHKDLRFRGFRNPGTTVMLPLSPTRLLSLDHNYGEPDGQYYRLSHAAAVTNALIWRDAIDHMFSPRHPDEVCAEIVADAELRGFA